MLKKLRKKLAKQWNDLLRKKSIAWFATHSCLGRHPYANFFRTALQKLAEGFFLVVKFLLGILSILAFIWSGEYIFQSIYETLCFHETLYTVLL